MSKQSLLEEFEWRCITISSFLERDSLKQFLSKAIDQTREETIKEILSELRLKLRKRGRPKQGRPKRVKCYHCGRILYDEPQSKPIADTAFLTESDLESVLNK